MRSARVGCGQWGQYVSEVAVYTFGFVAHLDGDVTAFGNKAAVDGSFLEHAGSALCEVAGRAAAPVAM